MRVMPRIAVVTCRELPEPDVDETITLEALSALGLEVEMAAWNDVSVDWGSFDVAVLRSCWDYPEFYMEFMDWLDRVETLVPVMNPVGIVRKNLDKRYLGELSEQGVPIVPTVYASGGDDLRSIVLDKGWETLVVKPVIGAGSMGTRVFGIENMGEAEKHLQGLGTVGMVQPFLRSVNQGGERALVWIDGAFTHKIVKSPRFADDDEAVSEAQELKPEELAFGESVMERVSEDLLYARVDVMAGDKGEIFLSELELIEPSLFFQQNPAALERFAGAVDRRAQALVS